MFQEQVFIRPYDAGLISFARRKCGYFNSFLLMMVSTAETPNAEKSRETKRNCLKNSLVSNIFSKLGVSASRGLFS